MINLGFDILLSIFDLLTQEDKLECMTVCQQWYDIIHTNSLFRDICIYNQKQLDLLMTRIERDPVLGEKVEKFLLNFQLDSDFDHNILTELFPNLRYYASKGILPVTGSLIRVEPRQNHPWCRHIEQIVGIESTLRTLLMSGVCKNLTSISMAGDLLNNKRGFIESLVNAPALKILDIRSYRMCLHDLELLHNIVPLLDSLWLIRTYFEPASNPPGIIPATSVKSLRCSNLKFNSLYDSSAFLSYISKKYTHAEELILACCFYSFSRQDRIALASYMRTLEPRLKSFSFIFDWEELELYGTFDFDTMFTSGCQIEKLELGDNVGLLTFERLAESAQAKYIRSLNISGINDIQLVESCSSSFSRLLRFTSLKELQLSSFRYDTFILNLTDLLENLRETRLEHLKLHDVQVQLDNSSRFSVYPSLKSLTLNSVIFDWGIDAFISAAFPNLKHLALQFPLGLKKSFIFPNLDLSYLEMINSTKEETFPVMVVTLGDGQRHLYNARAKETSVRFHRLNSLENFIPMPPTYCPSFDKSDITPILTITCHSAYDFHLSVRKFRN